MSYERRLAEFMNLMVTILTKPFDFKTMLAVVALVVVRLWRAFAKTSRAAFRTPYFTSLDGTPSCLSRRVLQFFKRGFRPLPARRVVLLAMSLAPNRPVGCLPFQARLAIRPVVLALPF